MGSIGDNVVDIYRASGMQFPGGGAANVAVHARRLGWDVQYLGVIGSDGSGRIVAEALRKEGVNIDGVHWVDEANSVTEITIDADGNRRFSGWVPPTERIVLDERSISSLAGVQWIYSNYASRTEHLLESLAPLAPIAFDFSYKEADYAEEILPHITVAGFSRDWLNDEEIHQLISWSRSLGVETVVVTRGSRGAIVATGDEIHVQPAIQTEVVDTLGAGDAFFARFVCGLEEGLGLVAAAAAAAHSAAAVCRASGAFGHGTAIDSRESEGLQHDR